MVNVDPAKAIMVLGVTPVLIGVLNAAVVKFGHSFAPFANMGLLSGGLIGLVQSIASRVFFIGAVFLVKKFEIKNDALGLAAFAGGAIVGSVLSAAALFAISVIAVKAGIMASTFAVSGLVILTIANTVLSMGGLFSDMYIVEKLEAKELLKST